MNQQFSMFDLWQPPAPPRPVYTPPPRRTVMTRAYGRDHAMQIDEDAPDPVEVEVRGIPCLINFAFGASTYTVQKPGSQFWSCTGYRNMATRAATVDDVIRLVEQHIDTPTSKMGLGGKLERWWPDYVLQWRQAQSFHGNVDRTTRHWGLCAVDVGQEACWADYDAAQQAALARMAAEGIDPNDVGPPPGHKGKWPRF